MSLPLPWVEKIFTKLILVYGRSFLDRWAGLEIDAVKADWAHELAALERSPNSITYALQNLPADKPPTVLEFRKIAWSAPAADMPQIAHKKATPENIAAALAGLSNHTGINPKDWARRILARHESGEKLNPTSFLFAKQALGMN